MTRLLEKALRRSNAVDREALCIVAGQKVRHPRTGPRPPSVSLVADICSSGSQVWSLRVDVHFLDDEGNMLDCASIAAMTALRHFRKPDVTVIGEEVTIVRLPRPTWLSDPSFPAFADIQQPLPAQHSMAERVPVPLAIHHSPMCLTFAFFGDE